MDKFKNFIFGNELVGLWEKGKAESDIKLPKIVYDSSEKKEEKSELLILLKQSIMVLLLSYYGCIMIVTAMAIVGLVTQKRPILSEISVSSLLLEWIGWVITPYIMRCVFNRFIVNLYRDGEKNLFKDVLCERENFKRIGSKGILYVLLYLLVISTWSYYQFRAFDFNIGTIDALSILDKIIMTNLITLMEIPILIFITKRVSHVKFCTNCYINYLISVAVSFSLFCGSLQARDGGYVNVLIASIFYVFCSKRWNSALMIIMVQTISDMIFTVLCN